MGNSSSSSSKKKNSKSPSTSNNNNNIHVKNTPIAPRASKEDDDDFIEETMADYDEDSQDEDDLNVGRWKEKIQTSSAVLGQQQKSDRRNRRQYSCPSTAAIVGVSSSTSSNNLLSANSIDSSTPLEGQMTPRGRSKSTANAAGMIKKKTISTSTRSSTSNNSTGSTSNIPTAKSGGSNPTKSIGMHQSTSKSQLPTTNQSSKSQQSNGGGSDSKMNNNNNDEDQLQLTPIQINLVRKLWQHVRVQGENGPGISILRQHLVFRCPNVRQIFSTDLDGQQTEIAYHKRLISHAECLSELLDDLVNNLERAQIFEKKLQDWGRLHANVRHIGFTADIWERFAESVNECTTNWCAGQKAQRCFDAQVAWTTIALYITEHLKRGYYEECRRQRKQALGGTGKTSRGVSDQSWEYGGGSQGFAEMGGGGGQGGGMSRREAEGFLDMDEYDTDGN